MKEITRIHLAKVAYDIELDAKKEIQKYIAALERYADDPELLDDIEIRITELLAERGVPSGGVISTDDVAAVRAQLGEPSDFAPEGVGDAAVGTERFNDEGKRVYRDTDNALVGGVLAGIARYFGIDSLWVRLLFLILLIPSFGTALIVYAILWAIIPPARTAAQKLQARGKPVTLQSIKAFSEDEKVSGAARTTRSVLRNLSGIFLIVLGVGVLVGTVIVVASVLFGIGFEGSRFVSSGVLTSWWFTTAMTLFAFAGGLLAALLFLLANALFRRRWNEKTGRIVVGIIAAGLLLFATGAGTAWYGSWQEQVKAYDSLQVSTVNLPAEFAGVKKLVVTAHSVGSPFNGPTNELAVEYAVDTRNAPRYELTALPGMEPHIVVDGDEARIAFKSNAAHNQFQGWIQPRLVIRGPALEELRVNQGIASYSTAYPDGQQQLKIWTGGTTRASISGQYQAVYVEGDGDTDVSSSSVTDLVIAMTGGSVTAGVVKTLAVTQPDACSAWGSYDSRMRVQVRAVSSGSLTYNGKNTPAHSPISNGCGLVVVEDNAETLTD